LVRRELFQNRDEEFLRFGVNVTNIDSSFVSKEDLVTFTNGLDADVEFGFLRVGDKRLDEEGVENAGGAFQLFKMRGI
jgi:hypothetical protein